MDSRGGSHNSVALNSTQHFALHITGVNRSMANRGPQGDLLEANDLFKSPQAWDSRGGTHKTYFHMRS